MGRKLDMFLCRTSKQTWKLKALLGLTVTRVHLLLNQRHVRHAQARGDVADLLRLGHLDRALLRVEQVIKEQKMMDAYMLIEGYCNLLTERATLLERQKECPEELLEAAASLVYAASRCGDLPELQDVRRIFTKKFGREFTSSAVELRSKTRVSTKMIQNLSTRQSCLESRIMAAKEISVERDIPVLFAEPSSGIEEVKEEQKQNNNDQTHPVPNSSMNYIPETDIQDNQQMNIEHDYKDVASAAQAAFKSAAFAAAAARAAVELSRSKSAGKGSGYQSGSDSNISDLTDKFTQLPGYISQSEDVQVTNSTKVSQLDKSSSSSSLDSFGRPETKIDECQSKRQSPVLYENKKVIYKNPPYIKPSNVMGSEGNNSNLHEEIDALELRSVKESKPVTEFYHEGEHHTGSTYHDKEEIQSTYGSKPFSVRTKRGY